MTQTRIYRKRTLLLILIMTAVAIGVAASSLSILYYAAFEQQRGRLREIAHSHARLMEAVARFDRRFSVGDLPGGADAATLGQIRDAHRHFKGFGETGEFTLAKRQGDRIVFLLRHRHYDLDRPKAVPLSSHLADPMRAALAGRSGTMVGMDYRGERVLAAFEPVAELDLGIVAKIDLSEVRAPFVRAGLASAGIGLGFILVGTLLFLRIANPLIGRLEESEEKYRALFEQGVDAVLMIDPNSGRILEFNERAYRSLGYERDEFARFGLADLGAVESADEVARHIDRVRRRGTDIFVTRHHTKKGEVRDILIAAKLIHPGDRTFIQGICRDITHRLRAEAGLKRSEARYQQLFEESPVALREEDFSAVKATLDGLRVQGVGDLTEHLRRHPELLTQCAAQVRIIDVNRASLKLHKAPDKATLLEVLHKALTDDDYCAVFKRELAAIWNGGLLVESEGTLHTLDGDSVNLDVRWVVPEEYRSSYARVLVSLTDLTARKKAEQGLRSSLREKEVLLREVHHRVKNNMQVIDSLLSVQARQADDPRLAAALAESRQRVRAMALVHEYLYRSDDMGRIDTRAFLETLTGNLRSLYAAGAQHISLSTAVDDVALQLDQAVPVGLIVNELVSNSLKHAFPESRGGRLRVALKQRPDRRIELSVEDDGVGMPDGVDPQRGDTLGLRLVTALADQLRAELHFDSGSNRAAGTRVRIRFQGAEA